MARRFGPIQGAGTSVTERDAEQPITEASLGWAAMAGLLERGSTNELILCTSKANAEAQTGNLIPDSTLPDCVRHYFQLASGAGGLALVRVTDGTELPSSVDLFARRADLHTKIGTLSAKNGGRWGGFQDYATGQVADELVDITETTIDTGVLTWNLNQWEGAYVELAGVPNVRYPVVGNTALGVIAVASDSTMASDLAAGGDPTNDRWYLVLEGRTDRGLEYEIDDGENDPANQFSLGIRLDGIEVIRWDDLSMDPDDPLYWVDVINNTDANFYVEVEDLWLGAIVPDIRPANLYGNWSNLTATVLTADVYDFTINSVGGGDPVVASFASADSHLAQTITITMTDALNGTVESDLFGSLGVLTLGAPFIPSVKWAPPFQIDAGGSPLAAADTLVIQFKPLGAVDSLVDGYLLPDVLDNGDKRYRIVANTHNTITVAVGSDMATDVAGGDDDFMVVAFQRIQGGRDGHAGVDDNDYIQAFDPDNSLFRRIAGRNLGLVKFAAPGVTSTNVQKAGAAFVDSGKAGAHQWRYEVPSTLTTATGIENHVNNVLGKSAYGDYTVNAHSFAYIVDPEAASKLKLVPTIGMILGREAQIAANEGGYHKAAAGLSATLPPIVKLITGEVLLDEEFLNPRGINVIRKLAGNFVIWGDRTTTSNTTWKFKHAREVMSYVINTLRENFDFALFEINDPITWVKVRSPLIGFFRTMYARRGLDRTLPFEQAVIIKLDTENNTLATQAAGDLNVDVSIAIPGTVERLNFSVGKTGIQTVGA